MPIAIPHPCALQVAISPGTIIGENIRHRNRTDRHMLLSPPRQIRSPIRATIRGDRTRCGSQDGSREPRVKAPTDASESASRSLRNPPWNPPPPVPPRGSAGTSVAADIPTAKTTCGDQLAKHHASFLLSQRASPRIFAVRAKPAFHCSYCLSPVSPLAMCGGNKVRIEAAASPSPRQSTPGSGRKFAACLGLAPRLVTMRIREQREKNAWLAADRGIRI
jgi:hypothetical protein